jgi:glycosyltransferase involved in cell wall biosynthesis
MTRTRTILHLLSQRPTLTGSGTTLDVLAHEAGLRGWRQHAVVGVPASAGAPRIDPIPAEQIHPLFFETAALDFPVPGMSDVMPYPSTRFSAMTEAQWTRYREAWRQHLLGVRERVAPDVIHSHHLWLLSSLIKDCFPGVPVVTHCHSTALRQMALCPDRAPAIVAGVRRNDAFVSLHQGQARQIAATLDIDPARIHVVGAGYRADLFHARDRDPQTADRLLYVGKLSAAKGLPSLLDAVEGLARRRPALRLHIAGSGAGPEADSLRTRFEQLGTTVRYHGQLDPHQLAERMRQCAVCVLPSFYEGLPLVLVEAAACGCRLVATALPGVVEELGPHLGAALHPVALPPMAGIDTPVAAAIPAFTERLKAALDQALDAAARDPSEDRPPPAVDAFRWSAVFQRIENVWNSLLGETGPGQ